jgi:hypothetical protein
MGSCFKELYPKLDEMNSDYRFDGKHETYMGSLSYRLNTICIAFDCRQELVLS